MANWLSFLHQSFQVVHPDECHNQLTGSETQGASNCVSNLSKILNKNILGGCNKKRIFLAKISTDPPPHHSSQRFEIEFEFSLCLFLST
jgi:hypothetical protein